MTNSARATFAFIRDMVQMWEPGQIRCFTLRVLKAGWESNLGEQYFHYVVNTNKVDQLHEILALDLSPEDHIHFCDGPSVPIDCIRILT